MGPKTAFTPTKQDPFSPSKQDMFSPPPLEPMEPPKPQPVLSSEPTEVTPQQAPTRNGIQNGFSEFVSSSKNLEVQTIQESSQSQSFQMNGTHEESGSIQGSSSSSSLLQKIMTPAPVEYDTGSLKRRDPRKMFTDSSFYNAQHHPTVADQVEMAHRLSSAMFNEKNKSSNGQKMFLTRVQNSGGMHDDDYQNRHDAVPNMKLVMNPEGKVHEWDDLPEDQKPNYQQIAVHAAPNMNLPDVVDPVAESLNAGIGKGGELFAKRRKRAENWVVDEKSVGQAKPSAFADKFMQEQTQQQASFQQQQQFKQEQSLEIGRQQEEQAKMAQQQMDFPQNFQHTDLKARSFTPSLDLGVHNVQGINVWANTAPRGWSTSYQRTKATPPKSNPPTVSVCPATPSLDTEIIQQRMQETKIAEQEEHMRFQQEQQMMQMQQDQQMKMQMDQQEQIRLQEEQMQVHEQQEEQIRIQRQQEEQMRMQQQQEQQMMMQRQQQEEQMRMQQQQEEQRRVQRQQEEQMRMQQQQEEQMRFQQQREEQMRMQQQQEMMMQQQSMSQTTSQVSSSSSTTKSGGFAVESRPQPVQIESQLAQPPMSSSSFESSQSQSFAQQSSSIQQSSSSYSQSQTSQNEVFESQEFSGGVMKGYRMKQDQVDGERETGEKMLSSGVFGGIGADNNSLVDTEIDYKKHTVKDLAKHFALV